MPEERTLFAQELKTLRKAAGYTQARLAEAAGVSPEAGDWNLGLGLWLCTARACRWTPEEKRLSPTSDAK